MPRRSPWCGTTIALCAFGLVLSGFHDAFAAPGARGAKTTECSRGVGSAVAEVACEMGRAIGTALPKTLVVAGLPTSDRPLADARGLSRLLARLVAGKLGPGTQAAAEAGDLAHARAIAQKHDVLVYLNLKIDNGELRVTGDTYPGHSSFWDRIRFGEPHATIHAFASRRIDAEIAAFLRPIPLVTTAIDKAAAPGKAVALACGDADADGSLELLVVGRQRLWLGRIVRRRFVVEHEAGWNSLSPVASAPLRQPIASAAIHPDEFIQVGVSDRSAAVRLSPDLHTSTRLSGAVPWDGLGCLGVSETALADVRPCMANEVPALREYEPKRALDAVASAHVTTRSGDAHFAVASRSPDGVLCVFDETRRTARMENAGAQLAIGDLDLDGSAEIVTSENTLDATRDAVVVSTWTAENILERRFRVPAPQGVLALAVCPPERSGLSVVAVATGSELWILR